MKHPWHTAHDDLWELFGLFRRAEAARVDSIRWETDCRSVLLRVMARMAFEHSIGGAPARRAYSEHVAATLGDRDRLWEKALHAPSDPAVESVKNCAHNATALVFVMLESPEQAFSVAQRQVTAKVRRAPEAIYAFSGMDRALGLMFRGMASLQRKKTAEAVRDLEEAWELATGERKDNLGETATWHLGKSDFPPPDPPIESWWESEPSKMVLLVLLETEMGLVKLADSNPNVTLALKHLQRASNLLEVNSVIPPWLDRGAIRARIASIRFLLTDDIDKRGEVFAELIDLFGTKNAKEYVETQLRYLQTGVTVSKMSYELMQSWFRKEAAFGREDILIEKQTIYRKTLEGGLDGDLGAFFFGVLTTSARVKAAYRWLDWFRSDVNSLEPAQLDWLDRLAKFLLLLLREHAPSDLDVLRAIEKLLDALKERGWRNNMKKLREVTSNWPPPTDSAEASAIWQRIRTF